VNPLTLIHIGAGTVALLAGAAALSFRKGGRPHGKAGTVFLLAMLVMAATGGAMAIVKPENPSTAIIATLTFYLVGTSWATARRRDGGTGLPERIGLAVASGCAALFLTLGMVAANSPTGLFDSYPAAMFFVFGAVAALAAALDLNYILRRGLSGRQRITRHLWRMCAALFIASGSFFLGQQDEFPSAVQGSPVLLALALAPLALMVFWLIRVRFSKASGYYAPRRAAPAAAASPIPAQGAV